MLKWFLDIFKSVTKADDGAICDLRAIKKRLNHRKGMIGLSVKVPSLKTYGDTESAAVLIMSLLNGKTPNDLSQCLDAVKIVQEHINNLVMPR